MDFQDKSIICSDCGATFTFSVVEQEYFQSRNYSNDPKRCLPCRKTNRTQRNGNVSDTPNRPMFPATCAECGKETKVPFEPRNGNPVYCSECYSKVKEKSLIPA
jgi:CxxC-x17-CxxC domain-containing protein